MISSALRNNYNHVEFDVLFDLTSKLTLRGGYRYVWGDSSSFVLPVSGLIGPESVEPEAKYRQSRILVPPI